MQEVLVNRLGGLSLPRKSVVKLTDRLDMTLDVYHGRKTTTTIIGNLKLVSALVLELSLIRCWKRRDFYMSQFADSYTI